MAQNRSKDHILNNVLHRVPDHRTRQEEHYNRKYSKKASFEDMLKKTKEYKALLNFYESK